MKPILASFLFLLSGVALADSSSPFVPKTPEYLFSAATTSGTPIQISAAQASTPLTSYRLFVTCSSATAIVTTTFQTSSDFAAAVVAPTAGSPQYTRSYPCGNPIEVLSGPSRGWFNAIVSTGTATIYIIGGDGV